MGDSIQVVSGPRATDAASAAAGLPEEGDE